MSSTVVDNGQHPPSSPRTVPIKLKSASLLDALAKVFERFWKLIGRSLRQLSPQLVSLLVCLLAIPILALFSFVAGLLVWKNVPKGWSIPVYLQYGDGGSPYADLASKNLFSNQPYDISLHLTVPASEANYGLGNFMISLTVTDYLNNTLAFVRKPSLVLPPYPNRVPFLSRTPRLLEMNLPLVTKLVTGREDIFVHIELGRNDGWRSLGFGEGRELSVYSAFLHGDVHPQGLRRILSAFPRSVAIAAAVAFFIVSTLVVIGFLLPSLRWHIAAIDEGDQKPPSPTQVEESQVKAESSDDNEFYPKDEDHEKDIPPAGSAFKTELELRLRSRRRSSHVDS